MTRETERAKIFGQNKKINKSRRATVNTIATPPRYKLDDLLKGITPKAMHEAYDWGPDRGREIVDK